MNGRLELEIDHLRNAQFGLGGRILSKAEQKRLSVVKNKAK